MLQAVRCMYCDESYRISGADARGLRGAQTQACQPHLLWLVEACSEKGPRVCRRGRGDVARDGTRGTSLAGECAGGEQFRRVGQCRGADPLARAAPAWGSAWSTHMCAAAGSQCGCGISVYSYSPRYVCRPRYVHRYLMVRLEQMHAGFVVLKLKRANLTCGGW